MRDETIKSRNGLSRRVIFELGDAKFLPWFLEVRQMYVDDERIHLEPPATPAVTLGRALACLVEQSGLLDSFLRVPGLHLDQCTLVCEVRIVVGEEGLKHEVKVHLGYNTRRAPDNKSRLQVTDCEIADYLRSLLLMDSAPKPHLAMRLNYLYNLVYVACSIDGLDIVM